MFRPASLGIVCTVLSAPIEADCCVISRCVRVEERLLTHGCSCHLASLPMRWCAANAAVCLQSASAISIYSVTRCGLWPCAVFCRSLLMLTSTIILIGTVTPFALPPLVPILMLFYFLYRYFQVIAVPCFLHPAAVCHCRIKSVVICCEPSPPPSPPAYACLFRVHELTLWCRQ